MGKLLNNLKTAGHSLFYGLKGGDNAMKTIQKNGEDTAVVAEVQKEDMYQYYQQQEHKYEYYKVLREADKYNVDVSIKGDMESDDWEMGASAKKKTPLDYICKVKYYNPEELPLKLIQENKLVLTKTNFEESIKTSLLENGTNDYMSIFNFERDGFTPRFKLEDYIKKIIIRVINDKEYYIDMYTTMYASQFGKVDAIFISQLKSLFETKNKRSDITDIKEISFTTNKAYGMEDMCTLHFTDVKYENIDVFDGNYVLTFKGVLKDMEDIVEKYRVESMDKKWEEKAPRENVDTNLMAIKRKMDKEENENCN